MLHGLSDKPFSSGESSLPTLAGLGRLPSGYSPKPTEASRQGMRARNKAKLRGSYEDRLAVDICCGLGGLSEGLRMAGFDVRLALDSSPSAALTYQRNNPGALVALQDLTQLNKFQRYLSAVGIGRGQLAVLAGGTPCQSFSAANSRKQPGRNEHHNLVLEFARLVKEATPALFLLENVPRMKTAENGELLADFLSIVESEGYKVASRNLWANEYGVPQQRRRLFLVGSRIGPYEFMPPSHGPNSMSGKPFVTVGDAILGDLPPALRRKDASEPEPYVGPPKNWYQRWCRVGSREVTNHVWNDLGANVVRRFTLIPPNRSWSQVQNEGGIPEDLQIRIDHRSVYRRLAADQPSVTIVHFRKAMTIHPVENRLITLREAARLQSFRDRFAFSNRGQSLRQMDSIQQQLANAVPPLLARAVARGLRTRLNR